MSQSVVKAGHGRFADCVDFVLPRERRCVTLASHLARNGSPFFLSESVREFEILEDDGKIEGLILLTATGILLHCLDDDVDREGFAAPIRSFLATARVRCILGKADDTRWFEALNGLPPERAVDYRLMALDAMPDADRASLPELGGTTRKPAYVRGKPADANRLLALQEGYEREEVIPPGDPFNRDACRANLAKNLGTQAIYYVRSGESALAKAGTNARGFRWDQLGGVYTAPEWRGKGLASALVAHVARERMREDRKIALFVKLTNDPAIKVYEKTGFRPDIGFRISYF